MFTFWKKEPEQDTTEMIFLGKRAYPLQCDPAVYTTSVIAIKDIFRSWIISEISLAERTNQENHSLLVKSLRDVDIKFLAHDEPLSVFTDTLMDTPVSFSGSRFMDTITRIHMTIPSDIADTCVGKFLFSMLYGLPKTVNQLPLPTKQQWQDALYAYPWIPYLVFYQDAYDSDEIIKRVEQIMSRLRSSKTTITHAAHLQGSST